MKLNKINLAAIFMFIVITLNFFTGCSIPQNYDYTNYNFGTKEKLNKFDNLDELNSFLSQESSSYGASYATLGGSRSLSMEESLSSVAPMMDDGGSVAKVSVNSVDATYSTTNVQVAGVDEADVLKSDGKYIYYVSDNVIYILDAETADDAEVISKIDLSNTDDDMRVETYISEIYINENQLIVLGNSYKSELRNDDEENMDIKMMTISSIAMPYPRYSKNFGFVKIFDIEDKKNPEEIDSIEVEGNYFNSRMIDGFVYVITNKYVGSTFEPILLYDGDVKRSIGASDIYYFNMPDNSYQVSTIIALDLDDYSFSEKSILKGYSQNVYVSENNIYLTNQKQISYNVEQRRILDEVIIPSMPSEIKSQISIIESYNLRDSTKISEIQYIIQEYVLGLSESEQMRYVEDMEDEVTKIQSEIQKEREKTVIHKLSINGKDINHEGRAEVSGRVLNQFSMDENSDGYFRIATTTGYSWSDDNPQLNHIYILDDEMDIVGKLEDLAPKERIYSARFMGDRLYLVTYRNIDPLFVIDLSNPTKPEVLGKLKIPGYSDYLHPYDENHIIGIGKETTENKENDRAYQQGVKLAIFDVTDVESPKEIAKVEIGDRGTDSDALYNHKAFLFSKAKGILAIPIRLAEIDEEKYADYDDEKMQWVYGDYTYQGLYVYKIDLEDGFDLVGRITHDEEKTAEKSGYYYYPEESVERSMYIGETLYTFSRRIIKASDLTNNLKELNKIVLKEKEEVYIDEPYYYGDEVMVKESSASIDIDNTVDIPDLDIEE